MDDRLNQALRTLRAIQQRYETGRKVDSGYIRSYTVQMALGYADMLWIAAAIEALEKVTAAPRNADFSGHPAAPSARASQPQHSSPISSNAFAARAP
jgi:hypothetical protein